MKQEKRISKHIDKYDREWPPEDAAGFLAWFQKLLDEVPPDRRATALIEISSIDNYADSSCATIEFSYTRIETDNEEAARIGMAEASAKRLRAEELRTLAALQAKYGKAA